MNFLILAGTRDGRELAAEFQKRGHQILVSTLTSYGAEIATNQGLNTRSGALDENSLRKILKEQEFDGLIDATHPYAQNIQLLAQHMAKECNLPYFRWERLQGEYLPHPLLHYVQTIKEAGALASRLGKRVFLSTGSRNLKDWVGLSELATCELFVRVLPTAQVLSKCEEAGLKPYQIVAMQGPFTQKVNEALWEQLRIDVVITKESGAIGGTDEKVQACLQLNIPVIILARPQESKPEAGYGQNIRNSQSNDTVEEFIRKVEDNYGY